MIFLSTLRMIVELSFYFFFAELFVVAKGNPSQFLPMIALCVCYGILVYLLKNNFKKIYLALPFVVLLFPGSHLIALLPPIFYILYLIIKENVGLSWDRQSDLFSVSYKVFLGAGLCLCLIGSGPIFIRYSLPMAFVSVVSSVLLMRMLRHDSSTFLNPQYQIKNCIFLVIVLFFAWLSSRDFVFNLLGNSIKFLYFQCLYPILMLLLSLVVFLIKLIASLLAWARVEEFSFEEVWMSQLEDEATKELLDSAVAVYDGSFAKMLVILFTIAAIVLAFFFFRWLALNRGEESIIDHGLDMIRSNNPEKTKKERSSSTVLQIRRQYRIFLKLYRDRGGSLVLSDTSEDILKRGSSFFTQTELMHEMREIYLNARYRNTASKADLKRMKQINKEMATSK